MHVRCQCKALQRLDEIWEVMQMPFDWSPDTLDAIALVMQRAGYKQVDEDTMRPIEERYGCWGELESELPVVAAVLRATHTPKEVS